MRNTAISPGSAYPSTQSPPLSLQPRYHTASMTPGLTDSLTSPSQTFPTYSTGYTHTDSLNEREPPLPARTHRFATTQPQQQYGNMAAAPPQPVPRENRKTFKCPKCKIIFDTLEPYRTHIKGCLK